MSQYESQFEENLYQLRRDKLAQIAAIARTLNPALTDAEARYPNAFPFTTTVPLLRAIGKSGDDNPLTTEELATMHIEAAIAGRIMAIRVQGKAGFAQLQQHGERLQLYVRKDDVGEAVFNLYKLLDLGDHIGVRGFLMRTRTGELTLHAAPITLPGHEGQPALTLLTKAMLALPDKYHGLEDVELRYRQRYVDLIVNSGHTAKPTPPPSAIIPSPSAVIPSPSAVIQSEAKDLSIPPEAPPLPAETTDTTDTPPNVREVFVKRAHILRSIRHFFDTRGYLEVETPMLHTISGGAAARPFETHHNALDIPLKLRIAPELYLKRLVVGGLDRVYEINRNFRNEGVSTQHNPEFTMLEFYQAYANYKDLMTITKELIAQVAIDVNGTTKTNFNGEPIDLAPENWRELRMVDAIPEFLLKELDYSFAISSLLDPNRLKEELTSILHLPILVEALLTIRNANVPRTPEEVTAFENLSDKEKTIQTLARAAKHRKALEEIPDETFRLRDLWSKLRSALDNLQKDEPIGKVIAEIFEAVAEPHLIQPTIIYDFPLAVSPLSKVKPDEPDWVERFEFYIGGFEVGNAFSELNDPDDQRARFEAQLAEKARGDDEAMSMDEDYVRALGYGLPPTAGEGIGIDRLTMILTGSRSIRDVILFPLMRPQKPTPETEAESTNQPHGESAE